MKTTIKDVAKLAGVSFKTVSRVINNEPSVKLETIEKVNQAIAQLQYQPNTAARNLAGTKSYAIGYVYDNPNAYYIINMQNGILKACQEKGYELIIHPCNAQSLSVTEELMRMSQRSQLAGLVLSPPLSEMAPVMDALDAVSIPYVRIVSGSATKRNHRPCVFVHDRDAARNIVAHMVSLGHKRIGFISGDKGHRSTEERKQGFREALAESGIAYDTKLEIDGTYSFESGVKGLNKLFESEHPPTAIFACNDEIASGALFAARLNGIDVPSQLAIAGFENSPFSRQTWPKLTTAAQPTDQIARQAAELLISEIQKERSGKQRSEPVSHVHFHPELVVRESTFLPE
ncbi:LacI family DNA-binding transcriptional regulator [Alteromonas oceanisediminis]|uniref:LacI family DNA-binding transcriptional regulator n=1 Tax=Alteromonas oceanisediminis TaxID=2836180 RepID=UPI001BDA99A6|nr:LacI family DNA-binding transcriptional regulator [Alteromonas oceanisediminis]MBT0586790.1 LacI family DNA-binding transcriptional regulator [Alteromonas oceanisediminis]